MKMVEESERIWGALDGHDERLLDHCKRITTLEQDHLWRDKSKANKVTYLLTGIIVLQFLFLAWDKIW